MDTWIVDGELGDLQATLRKFLNRRNMHIVEESDREIHFKQGSQYIAAGQLQSSRSTRDLIELHGCGVRRAAGINFPFPK
jgi:hypothetical protein